MLPKSGFAKNVSILAGGTAAGQLIVVAATPILTRLYSPEDFGLLAVYAGILGILGVIASMRYQLAIPLPESDGDAATVAVLSVLVVILTTLLTGLAIWLYGTDLTTLLNTPALQPYLCLVPIGLFLTGIYQVFQYWAIRTRDFPNIARTRLSQSLGMVVTQVAGYSLGPVALLLGRVVGQSAGTFSLMRSAFSQAPAFRSATLSKIAHSAKEYRQFPLVSTWTGLSSSGGSNLPPILIAASLGVGPAGVFALAHRVLSQPMQIIGRAIGEVFYQKAAEANRSGKLGYVVDRVYASLSVLVLPLAVALFIVIPEVFIFVFGSEWGEAGYIARWMMPWLFLQLLVTPSTRIFPILGLHGVALRFQLGLLFSTVVSVVIGGWFFKDLVVTVVLISSLSASVYLWRIIYVYHFLSMNALRPVWLLLKAGPLSLLCNAPLIFLFLKSGAVIANNLLSWALVGLSLVGLTVVTVLNLRRVKA